MNESVVVGPTRRGRRGTFFTKGLRMGTGQAPVKRYNRHIRDLITDGRTNPSWIVSHELPLADSPDAYGPFDKT